MYHKGSNLQNFSNQFESIATPETEKPPIPPIL